MSKFRLQTAGTIACRAVTLLVSNDCQDLLRDKETGG